MTAPTLPEALKLPAWPAFGKDAPTFGFLPEAWTEALKPVKQAHWQYWTAKEYGGRYNATLRDGTALAFPGLCDQGVFYAAHLYAVCANMPESVPVTLTISREGITLTQVCDGLKQSVTLKPRMWTKKDTLVKVTLQ